MGSVHPATPTPSSYLLPQKSLPRWASEEPVGRSWPLFCLQTKLLCPQWWRKSKRHQGWSEKASRRLQIWWHSGSLRRQDPKRMRRKVPSERSRGEGGNRRKTWEGVWMGQAGEGGQEAPTPKTLGQTEAGPRSPQALLSPEIGHHRNNILNKTMHIFSQKSYLCFCPAMRSTSHCGRHNA